MTNLESLVRKLKADGGMAWAGDDCTCTRCALLREIGAELDRLATEPACSHPADSICPTCHLTEMNINAKAGQPVEAVAVFEGRAVKAWAASLVEWFRVSGGQNYVTCDLRDPTTGEAYSITMQKAGGRTPAQDLLELRAQANRPAEPRADHIHTFNDLDPDAPCQMAGCGMTRRGLRAENRT